MILRMLNDVSGVGGGGNVGGVGGPNKPANAGQTEGLTGNFGGFGVELNAGAKELGGTLFAGGSTTGGVRDYATVRAGIEGQSYIKDAAKFNALATDNAQLGEMAGFAGDMDYILSN